MWALGGTPPHCQGSITPFPILPTLTERSIIYIVFYIEKKEREREAGKSAQLETKPKPQTHTHTENLPRPLEMRSFSSEIETVRFCQHFSISSDLRIKCCSQVTRDYRRSTCLQRSSLAPEVIRNQSLAFRYRLHCSAFCVNCESKRIRCMLCQVTAVLATEGRVEFNY